MDENKEEHSGDTQSWGVIIRDSLIAFLLFVGAVLIGTALDPPDWADSLFMVPFLAFVLLRVPGSRRWKLVAAIVAGGFLVCVSIQQAYFPDVRVSEFHPYIWLLLLAAVCARDLYRFVRKRKGDADVD